MYKLLEYASQAMWRAVHGITATWKIIRVDRVAKDAGRVKYPKRGEKIAPLQDTEKQAPAKGQKATSTGQ